MSADIIKLAGAVRRRKKPMPPDGCGPAPKLEDVPAILRAAAAAIDRYGLGAFNVRESDYIRFGAWYVRDMVEYGAPDTRRHSCIRD
jgi:hypothetical protein